MEQSVPLAQDSFSEMTDSKTIKRQGVQIVNFRMQEHSSTTQEDSMRVIESKKNDVNTLAKSQLRKQLLEYQLKAREQECVPKLQQQEYLHSIDVLSQPAEPKSKENPGSEKLRNRPTSSSIRVSSQTAAPQGIEAHQVETCPTQSSPDSDKLLQPSLLEKSMVSMKPMPSHQSLNSLESRDSISKKKEPRYDTISSQSSITKSSTFWKSSQNSDSDSTQFQHASRPSTSPSKQLSKPASASTQLHAAEEVSADEDPPLKSQNTTVVSEDYLSEKSSLVTNIDEDSLNASITSGSTSSQSPARSTSTSSSRSPSRSSSTHQNRLQQNRAQQKQQQAQHQQAQQQQGQQQQIQQQQEVSGAIATPPNGLYIVSVSSGHQYTLHLHLRKLPPTSPFPNYVAPLIGAAQDSDGNRYCIEGQLSKSAYQLQGYRIVFHFQIKLTSSLTQASMRIVVEFTQALSIVRCRLAFQDTPKVWPLDAEYKNTSHSISQGLISPQFLDPASRFDSDLPLSRFLQLLARLRFPKLAHAVKTAFHETEEEKNDDIPDILRRIACRRVGSFSGLEPSEASILAKYVYTLLLHRQCSTINHSQVWDYSHFDTPFWDQIFIVAYNIQIIPDQPVSRVHQLMTAFHPNVPISEDVKESFDKLMSVTASQLNLHDPNSDAPLPLSVVLRQTADIWSILHVDAALDKLFDFFAIYCRHLKNPFNAFANLTPQSAYSLLEQACEKGRDADVYGLLNFTSLSCQLSNEAVVRLLDRCHHQSTTNIITGQFEFLLESPTSEDLIPGEILSDTLGSGQVPNDGSNEDGVGGSSSNLPLNAYPSLQQQSADSGVQVSTDNTVPSTSAVNVDVDEDTVDSASTTPQAQVQDSSPGRIKMWGLKRGKAFLLIISLVLIAFIIAQLTTNSNSVGNNIALSSYVVTGPLMLADLILLFFFSVFFKHHPPLTHWASFAVTYSVLLTLLGCVAAFAICLFQIDGFQESSIWDTVHIAMYILRSVVLIFIASGILATLDFSFRNFSWRTRAPLPQTLEALTKYSWMGSFLCTILLIFTLTSSFDVMWLLLEVLQIGMSLSVFCVIALDSTLCLIFLYGVGKWDVAACKQNRRGRGSRRFVGEDQSQLLRDPESNIYRPNYASINN